MLVFSEGVPRSGKSYDAVKSHILPALKKGRRVYARLNGLDHDAIADKLGLSVERVRELLVPVGTGEVLELFKAQQMFSEAGSSLSSPGHSGQWEIDDKFKNALVVIDEVHEFYVGGTREALSPAIEQFFALHGHYGMDILVMTQFYKRVHQAIRYRIERKTTYQKLSALGKKGESLFRISFFQTVAPDKYEKVGGETRAYDASIYPLYHGIVGGDAGQVQQEVYSGGRTTIWRGMALRAAIILPLGLAAVWYLLDFFSGGGTALVKTTSIAAPQKVQPGGVWQQPVQAAGTAVVEQVKPADIQAAKLAKMTPEQRYVWKLSQDSRIRYVGALQGKTGLLGLVEWLDSSLVVKDQLTLDQIKELGVAVTVLGYGLRLAVGDEVIIATSWPVERPRRDPSPRLYDTSGGGLHAVSASEPHATAAATTGSGAPMGNDWTPPSSGNMVRAGL